MRDSNYQRMLSATMLWLCARRRDAAKLPEASYPVVVLGRALNQRHLAIGCARQPQELAVVPGKLADHVASLSLALVLDQ